MARTLFASAILLVSVGVLTSIYGISQERMKPIAIGLVLILGAGVFATLYLGIRRRIER